jgi:hypothetical protein
VSTNGSSRCLRALAFVALLGVAGTAPAADGRADSPAPPNATATNAPGATTAAPPTPASSTTQITDFTNPRHVIASGSGSSSGGTFEISGTIGQADADPLQPSTGGNFAITGGFWFTTAAQADGLFEDGFEGP